MKNICGVGLLALLATAAWAQSTVPRGTVLPVALISGIRSNQVHPGQEIKAEIMQDVPAAQPPIPRGTKLFGHIVSSHISGKAGSSLSLKFDRLRLKSEDLRLVTDLRAVASFMAVHDAQLPLNGPDRGTSEASWTTVQVGADVVYRGGGPVTSGSEVVGKPVPGGVLVRVRARPGTRCRGPLDGDQPQALWVFSSDACGVYGFDNLAISHAGRTAPAGEIVLTSTKKQLKLARGTGLLLRVNAPH